MSLDVIVSARDRAGAIAVALDTGDEGGDARIGLATGGSAGMPTMGAAYTVMDHEHLK